MGEIGGLVKSFTWHVVFKKLRKSWVRFFFFLFPGVVVSYLCSEEGIGREGSVLTQHLKNMSFERMGRLQIIAVCPGCFLISELFRKISTSGSKFFP